MTEKTLPFKKRAEPAVPTMDQLRAQHALVQRLEEALQSESAPPDEFQYALVRPGMPAAGHLAFLIAHRRYHDAVTRLDDMVRRYAEEDTDV